LLPSLSKGSLPPSLGKKELLCPSLPTKSPFVKVTVLQLSPIASFSAILNWTVVFCPVEEVEEILFQATSSPASNVADSKRPEGL